MGLPIPQPDKTGRSGSPTADARSRGYTLAVGGPAMLRRRLCLILLSWSIVVPLSHALPRLEGSGSVKPHVLAVLYGRKAGSWFGRHVAGVGDVNGDGFDDYVVVAQEETTAYVFFGSPGVNTRPDLLLKPVDWAVTGGDFNGDGYSDIAAAHLLSAVRVYLGGPQVDAIPDGQTNIRPPFYFGATVAAGDVNGDGYDDLLVSEAAGRQNYVYLFLGSENFDLIPDARYWQTSKPSGGQAIFGDWNCDGYDDIFVASMDWCYVYFGGPTVPRTPDLTFRNTGRDFWTFGDLNGDGYDDLCNSYAGIFLGSPQPDTVRDVAFDRVIHNGWGDPFMLSGPGATGYFNRDRYADLLLGTPGAYGSVGAAWLYMGGDPVDGHYDWAVIGPDVGYFGIELANAGDVNGDGVEDFLISESEYLDFSRQGRVFVVSGDTTGATGVPGQPPAQLPVSMRLFPPFPNPSNGRVVLRYELGRRARVRLSVFDALGREVARLTDGWKATGRHRAVWNGRDRRGNPVPSGVYIVRLRAEGRVESRKLTLLR